MVKNLLENDLVFDKIFVFSDLNTKKNLQKVGKKIGKENVLRHRISNTKFNLPCFWCIYELALYYSTNCMIYLSISDQRMVKISMKEVREIMKKS